MTNKTADIPTKFCSTIKTGSTIGELRLKPSVLRSDAATANWVVGCWEAIQFAVR